MKYLKLLSAGFLATILASCQSDGGNLLSDATPADSLVYYFGQMRGLEYKRQSEVDTTLKEQSAKQAYIQGIQAGLSGVREDDEAYNKGFMLGMQMAMNFKQFHDQYDVTINKEIFVKSVSQALNSDSLPSQTEMQGHFYRIMGQFNAEKEAKDKQAAIETVSQEAKNMNLPMISEELYGSVTEKTDGEKIKDGDEVTLDMKLEKPDGEKIQAPFPNRAKVGARNIPEVLNTMLLNMNSGETGKYITSARALFGQRVAQMNIEPSQVIVMTLKADVKEQPKE